MRTDLKRGRGPRATAPHRRLRACRGSRACFSRSGISRRQSGSASRPVRSKPGKTKSGLVSPTIQESESKSRMRMTMARARPICRAFFCFAAGSLSARIEMKITLSIPRTISRRVRVRSPIQACGSESHSILQDQSHKSQKVHERAASRPKRHRYRSESSQAIGSLALRGTSLPCSDRRH